MQAAPLALLTSGSLIAPSDCSQMGMNLGARPVLLHADPLLSLPAAVIAAPRAAPVITIRVEAVTISTVIARHVAVSRVAAGISSQRATRARLCALDRQRGAVLFIPAEGEQCGTCEGRDCNRSFCKAYPRHCLHQDCSSLASQTSSHAPPLITEFGDNGDTAIPWQNGNSAATTRNPRRRPGRTASQSRETMGAGGSGLKGEPVRDPLARRRRSSPTRPIWL